MKGPDNLRRPERLAAAAMTLMRHPGQQHNLEELAGLTGVARSTASEDVRDLVELAGRLGAGRIETAPGPLGGVRYWPDLSADTVRETLAAFAAQLRDPTRVLPGGFLYLTDLACSPDWSARLGEIFAQSMRAAAPTCVLTVETRGIPLALMTARALGLPLLVARRDSRVAEGPALSISYMSASSGRVLNMSLPRRALHAGARVLIIDDFMRGGASAKGLIDLAAEFEAQVVGTGVAIATAQPAVKRARRYLPLFTLERVDEASRWIEIEPNWQLVSCPPV